MILLMAFRNILRQKKRSAIIAATAAVGMLAVTASQGFINGFTDSLVAVAIDTGLGHAQIRPKGYLDSRQMDLLFPEAKRVEEKFRNVLPEGVHYAPRMEREAILRIGSETRGVLLVGMDPEKEGLVSAIPTWKLTEGTFLDQPSTVTKKGGVSCLIGNRLGHILEVATGDRIVLSTGSVDGTTQNFVCWIQGLYESPSKSLEENLILLRLTDLSAIRSEGHSDEVGYFVIRGTDLEQSEAIAETIRNALAGETGVEVASMKQIEPLLASLIDLYDNITWIFYFIILAGFGIVLFESVTMSIFERMHEIGIMHAIGSKPGILFHLVTLESLMLTIMGSVIGMILGTAIITFLYNTGFHFSASNLDTQSWGASSVSTIYPYLVPQNFLEGITVALVIGFLSALYPARRAVRVSPLDAIHRR